MCDPEIVIQNWDESPVRGPYHGHEGLFQWWEDFAEVIEDARFELIAVTDLGDGRILTINKLAGTFRLTGIELVDAFWGSIITVRNGQIAGARGYATPGQAKKAAGLPEPAG